jgi:hypothetical protein
MSVAMHGHFPSNFIKCFVYCIMDIYMAIATHKHFPSVNKCVIRVFQSNNALLSKVWACLET